MQTEYLHAWVLLCIALCSLAHLSSSVGLCTRRPPTVGPSALLACLRSVLSVFTMGRPLASPKDGSSAAPSSAKPNAAKPNTKARDKKGGGKGGNKGGGKAGGGGASSVPEPLAPPATLFPSLPLPILQLSLALPSPLDAPAASTCGATALAAISAALVDYSRHHVVEGDVRRTLGAAVADWVKSLGGGGADGSGGGGAVVENVGRYVAAEIAALPADDDGADTLAGEAGNASDPTAMGVLLSGKVKEFGQRRIVAACQAVGEATAEAVLRSGDEVVVWGVGAQPEVLAALERYVRLVAVLRVWLELELPRARRAGGFVLLLSPPGAVVFGCRVRGSLRTEPERNSGRHLALHWSGQAWLTCSCAWIIA